jgi:hypothetical protein
MNQTESGRKSSCPHGTACNSVSKRSSGAAASRIVRRKTRHQKVASETMGLNGASASAGFELLQSDLELTTEAPPHPRALVRFLWPLLLISVCTYVGPDVLYLLRGQRPLP